MTRWPCTVTSCASVWTSYSSARSNGLPAMLCATTQVSARLTGHSSSSGVSIQSRISPNRERCSRWKIFKAGSRAASAAPSALDLLEAVAQAAHGGDADRALLDLLAQAVDVHLDRIGADFLAPLAQPLDQLVLADQAAGALQQHFEQPQLPGRQLDHPAVDGSHPPGLVVHQRPVLDRAAGAAHAAPGQRAHPGLELLQAERLGHVVVRA